MSVARALASLTLAAALLSGGALAESKPPERPAPVEAAPEDATPTETSARPPQKPEPPAPEEPTADKPAPAAAATAPATTDATASAPETPAPDDATAKPDISAAPALRSTLRESDFDQSACLLTLFTLGTGYEELPAISEADNRDCGIDRPVRITEILPGIALDGAPVMRCDTARHLAFWLRDSVRPASAFLPGAPRLTGIEPGSTYQCRGVVGGQSTATVSEHALGNAFDIAAFRFDDGTRLEIAPRQDKGSIDEAFQAAIRGTACLWFTTVLGPGANAAHDNHLHLDIKARKGGFRICQ
ncbi:extensin family protein [Paracoccus aminophilus]|uniref:Extensin-like C-terminal domain-containing protein n=1 Tax=Paracoccus aminophilus JCM 7686 TaxID=1367847 RepID=S5YY64_PARAH|nr:extensin family protein [Paracoccus aminophilus]AGT10121.1 hypothetical protein JCM7686_3085 [Paracoccus aminophilus JCM 7686]